MPQTWFVPSMLFVPLLFAMSLVSCAPAVKPGIALSPEAQQEAEVQRTLAAQSFYDRLERLNAVGHALVSANTPICRLHGRVSKSLGLTADYFSPTHSKEWYQALSSLWGVDENTIVVTGVAPGSAAAKAGIMRGDIITDVNGKAYNLKGKRTNISRGLNNLAAKGPVSLSLLRSDKPLSVTLQATEEVCASTFFVLSIDSAYAFADGSSVFASYGIMNILQKDEDLAIILGHEMAHNILGHVRKDASGKVLPSSPQIEAEADAVGLYFAARAGFDIENASSVWRHMAAQNPRNIAGNVVHPSSASRFVELEAIKKEILQMKAAGLPITPRLRGAPN